MRLATALLLVAAGCGGAQASERSAAATAPVCETLLDAGTPCDPCPGSPRQWQADYITRDDAGVIVSAGESRGCDCPSLPDGGHPHGNVGVQWPACPPLSAEVSTVLNWPQPTCATVLAEYQATCR